MKVRELIELLTELGPETLEREVILSIDSEGNGFKPMSSYSFAAYDAECDDSWYGEIGIEELTPELEAEGYSEDDLRPNGVPAIVLWP
jgi:hypothetical protein